MVWGAIYGRLKFQILEIWRLFKLPWSFMRFYNWNSRWLVSDKDNSNFPAYTYDRSFPSSIMPNLVNSTSIYSGIKAINLSLLCALYIYSVIKTKYSIPVIPLTPLPEHLVHASTTVLITLDYYHGLPCLFPQTDWSALRAGAKCSSILYLHYPA